MKFRNALLAISLAATSAAFAQTTPPEPSTSTPRIDKREAKQEQRIAQGTASGALTQREADRLNAGQTRVDNAQAKASADGKVTRKERAHLTHMQNKQNRHIAHQKHDKQKM
ncbi:MAG: hypothetical protein ACKO1L_08425 [Brachymonas sp.]